MDRERIKAGTYVLFEERCGITYYWRGGFDLLRRPRDTPQIMLAELFVSARHAYVNAKPHRGLQFWHARWIGPPGFAPGPEWDAQFSTRLMATMFPQRLAA